MIAVIDDYWQRRRHIFITTPVASHKTVWMRLCFWALITHPLLDLFTSFGTQLLLPFSAHRFALSAIPIIDLVYSVPLLLSIIWGLWVRWQAAAIGCVTLFATTCYLFWGLAQHDIALEHVQNYCASKQLACHKIEAYPLLPTIFAHRLVAFAEDTMHISEFSSWTGEVKPWVKFAHTPLPEPLRSDARLQTYHWFTKGIWLGHVSAPYTFCMFDARYGSLSHQPRGLFNMCIKGDETFINLSDFEASFNKLGFMAKCRRFIQYGFDVYRWALGLQA
jgi:inner membrane protein